MAGTFYPIKGVPDDPFTPGTKFRQEINRWMEDRKNKKQVDLFMLALRDMQKTDYQELLSYYRIAGKLKSCHPLLRCIFSRPRRHPFVSIARMGWCAI